MALEFALPARRPFSYDWCNQEEAGMERLRRMRRRALLVGLVALACGGEKKPDEQGEAGKTVGEPAVPAATVDTTPLPLGVGKPADFGYEWGKGAKPFARASAAHKRQEWVAVREACEEAIAEDATHLEAHRLLASALAQQGEYEKALDHLKIALAGDWVRWGGAVESDPDLEPLASSSLGARLGEMAAAYRQAFAASARTGMMVVARRAPFKEPSRPKKAGASSRLSSRAEVFVYLKATQRYLRLTQTGFQVLGFLAAPSGDEIAYVAATHAAIADPPTSAPPMLAVAQVGTVSMTSPEVKNPAATFKGARALAVEYLAGDELVVTSHAADGQWGLGQAQAFTIERATGKAKPTRTVAAPAAGAAEPGAARAGANPTNPPDPARPPAPADPASNPGAADPAGGTAAAADPAGAAAPTEPAAPSSPPPPRRLLVRYELVELEAPGDGDGIAADWNPETGAAEEFVIDSSKRRVQLPSGEAALRSSLAWSPDRNRLAFATAADPCAAQQLDRQSALYLVEAESGKLKHVFKGVTRFRPRFLDPAILAFEDDAGGIRLHDAAVAREVGRLENRGGLSFVGLGATPGLPCTGEPTAAPAGSSPANPTQAEARPAEQPPPSE
jgi:hypothetical protein